MNDPGFPVGRLGLFRVSVFENYGVACQIRSERFIELDSIGK